MVELFVYLVSHGLRTLDSITDANIRKQVAEKLGLSEAE